MYEQWLRPALSLGVMVLGEVRVLGEVLSPPFFFFCLNTKMLRRKCYLAEPKKEGFRTLEPVLLTFSSGIYRLPTA